jgi:hypothetical protein
MVKVGVSKNTAAIRARDMATSSPRAKPVFERQTLDDGELERIEYGAMYFLRGREGITQLLRPNGTGSEVLLVDDVQHVIDAANVFFPNIASAPVVVISNSPRYVDGRIVITVVNPRHRREAKMYWVDLLNDGTPESRFLNGGDSDSWEKGEVLWDNSVCFDCPEMNYGLADGHNYYITVDDACCIQGMTPAAIRAAQRHPIIPAKFTFETAYISPCYKRCYEHGRR